MVLTLGSGILRRTGVLAACALVLLCQGSLMAMSVKVVEVVSGVEVRKAPGDWTDCTAGMTLTEGHEVSCDPDGTVTLAFENNSTVVVQPMTQIKIAAFAQKGGVVETEILLKVGELAAKVNKSETIRSDFKVRSPTATASVRGTEIRSIRFDLVRGMQIAMASGTLDMAGSKRSTTTRLSGTDAGSTSNDGTVTDAQSTTRQGQATNAFPDGYSPDEESGIQSRSEPIVGDPQASYDSVEGLGGIAIAQLITKTIISEDFNNGVAHMQNGVFIDVGEPNAFAVASANSVASGFADSSQGVLRATAPSGMGAMAQNTSMQPPQTTVIFTGLLESAGSLHVSFDYNLITTATGFSETGGAFAFLVAGIPPGTSDLNTISESGAIITDLLDVRTGNSPLPNVVSVNEATLNPVFQQPSFGAALEGPAPQTQPQNTNTNFYSTGTTKFDAVISNAPAGAVGVVFGAYHNGGSFPAHSTFLAVDNVKVETTQAAPTLASGTSGSSQPTGTSETPLQ